MRIAGAIFDCDGTLLDSMYLWDVVLWRVTSARGLGFSEEELRRFFRECEDEPLRQIVADFWPRVSDVWASSDALYEDVCAEVRRAYAEEVKVFPGVRRFLDELAAAGVPMAVASSTPVREVRAGLEAHGLASYFKDVVSTEDVGGRDKQYPDVYLEAVRRLGTQPAETWVFEDAPFGVATPRAAGFPVCALYNDHDGRDQDFLREHACILAHGWREVSLALLEDYAEPPTNVRGVCRVLVVDGSPAPSSPELVARLAAEARAVIAVDRGAETCRAAGVVPTLFVGDADSCSSEVAAWARERATRTIDFPTEKYATDLALAIEAARHEAAREGERLELTLTCAAGGRPDHALAVTGLLAGAADSSPVEVEDAFELRILSPEGRMSWELGPAARGRVFSLVPLTGAVVSERGMRWELAERRLAALGDEGVSNVVTSPDARVGVAEGVVACYLLGESAQVVAPA